jgi:hypothetical protein
MSPDASDAIQIGFFRLVAMQCPGVQSGSGAGLTASSPHPRPNRLIVTEAAGVRAFRMLGDREVRGDATKAEAEEQRAGFCGSQGASSCQCPGARNAQTASATNPSIQASESTGSRPAL